MIEGWKQRKSRKKFEYQPPQNLRIKCEAIFLRIKPVGLESFFIGLERRAEINRALNRFSALLALEAELIAFAPFEQSLARVSTAFHSNQNSLRQWAAAFSKFGFAGLMEKKRGRSGCKAKGKQ